MSDALVLLFAVVVSSLLGSLHCVGMCGPLALWAGGVGESGHSSRGTTLATSLYHVGRLLTYAILGIVAGAIGSAIDLGGSTLGVGLAAARVVGLIMVATGVWKIGGMIVGESTPSGPKPSQIGLVLAKVRPYIFKLPLHPRALATGMLTTLLPCGWLYLFALIAAGTGSPRGGLLLMSAFWLGTVPALIALVAGTRLLSQRFRRSIPALVAIFLIGAGIYTASGRGFDGFESLDALVPEGDTLQQVQHADEVVLPCCREEP